MIETDHQPLVTIHNKPFQPIPARLQRMMLQLQKFDLTLTYKKGKHLFLADTLSRAPRCNASPQRAERPEFEVMTVQLISPRRLEELRQYTATHLSHSTGLFKSSLQKPTEVKSFFSFRDELNVEDGVICPVLGIPEGATHGTPRS